MSKFAGEDHLELNHSIIILDNLYTLISTLILF